MLINLYTYLKIHKITQQELAQAAGCVQSFVCMAIAGERRFSDEQIERIRSAFPQIPKRLFRESIAA